MSIKSDIWIERMVREYRMIDPFESDQISDGIISYGLGSYGYDIRVADEFKKILMPIRLSNFKGRYARYPPIRLPWPVVLNICGCRAM
jgi:deoxycytidine triphosphate deaminase